MGGDGYERQMVPVAAATAASGWAAKATDAADPRKTPVQPTNAATPIVLCMDISGSMGKWPKVVYEKMPMFYGQMTICEYVKDPAMAFSLYLFPGEASNVIQCTSFERGSKIDDALHTLSYNVRQSWKYMDGTKATNPEEGVEYGAFPYVFNTKNDHKGYFFIVGDGLPMSINKDGILHKKVIEAHVGMGSAVGDVKLDDLFAELRQRYDVFYILSDPMVYGQMRYIDQVILERLVGKQRIVRAKTPKAIVDIMLGILAISGGTRTMDEYADDMKERGQTEERIAEVTDTLQSVCGV